MEIREDPPRQICSFRKISKANESQKSEQKLS